MPHRMEAGFEHLREAMARVLAEEIEFPPGVFVTVLKAKMTANTAHASFVLSVLPEAREEEVLETLRRFDHDLKDGLAQALRLRRIPDFHFSFDRTEAEAAEIEAALNRLRDNDRAA